MATNLAVCVATARKCVCCVCVRTGGKGRGYNQKNIVGEMGILCLHGWHIHRRTSGSLWNRTDSIIEHVCTVCLGGLPNAPKTVSHAMVREPGRIASLIRRVPRSTPIVAQSARGVRTGVQDSAATLLIFDRCPPPPPTRLTRSCIRPQYRDCSQVETRRTLNVH